MEKTISWIITNHTLIIALVCVIVVMIERIIEFVALPTDKRMAQVKVILLEWVRQAELDLGDKTGKFKLAQVYEKFVITYPNLAKWYSLEKFEKLVQDALKEMEKSFENVVTKNNALKLK